jgi:hypothetical protein
MQETHVNHFRTTLTGGALGAALISTSAGTASSTSTTASSSEASPAGAPAGASAPSQGGHAANGTTEQVLTDDTAEEVTAAALAEVDGGDFMVTTVQDGMR